MVLFTSGLGTPTGNPITPVVKLSTNSILAERMHDIIDIDTGAIVGGEKTIQQMGDDILNLVVQSGEQAKSDRSMTERRRKISFRGSAAFRSDALKPSRHLEDFRLDGKSSRGHRRWKRDWTGHRVEIRVAGRGAARSGRERIGRGRDLPAALLPTGGDSFLPSV